MSDSVKVDHRLVIPVIVGMLCGWTAGGAAAAAALPAFGYWGALGAKMLAAAAVAGLVSFPLAHYFSRQQPPQDPSGDA